MVVREIYMSRTCAKVNIRQKNLRLNINTVYSMFEEQDMSMRKLYMLVDT